MMFKFKLLNSGATMPVRSTEYSAGFDVRTCNTDHLIEIDPFETLRVPLGIAIEDFGVLHKDDKFISAMDIAGYSGNLPYLELHLRSSMRMNGLSSGGVGIIDLDYRGEISLILQNLTPNTVKIPTQNRIGQLVVCASPVRLMSQCKTKNITRTGGFGSTGT